MRLFILTSIIFFLSNSVWIVFVATLQSIIIFFYSPWILSNSQCGRGNLKHYQSLLQNTLSPSQNFLGVNSNPWDTWSSFLHDTCHLSTTNRRVELLPGFIYKGILDLTQLQLLQIENFHALKVNKTVNKGLL